MLITLRSNYWDELIGASACSADGGAYFGQVDDCEDRAVFCREFGVNAQDEGKHKEYSQTSAKVGNNHVKVEAQTIILNLKDSLQIGSSMHEAASNKLKE